MSNDVRITDPDSTSIFKALSFKPVQKPEQQPEVVEQPVKDDTQLPTIDTVAEQPAKGNVPATINKIDFTETNNNTNNDDDLLPPLAVLDQGQVQPDPELLPPLDPNATQNTTADNSPEKTESSKNHSTQKALAHMWTYGIKAGLSKVATGMVTRATNKAVTKELSEIVAKAAATKVLPKTIKATATLEKILTEGATIGTAKTIANVTGKGVATIGVKEAARESGNIIKGLTASGKAAGEIIFKDGVMKAIPNTAGALVKTGIGAGEKVMSVGLTKGTEKALAGVIEKAGPETAGKLFADVAKTTAKGGKAALKGAQKGAAQALTKETSEAVSKATAEVAVKGTSKFAKGMGAVVPWIGTGVGVAITAWDAHDAIQKSKDSTASTASKALAWTTVGLDVVSTASTATGKGAAIGWAATGLSIGTSFLSDYLR
jgi:hypothetical protein